MVDVMMFDGSLLRQVQVMTSFASSRTGVVNLPVSDYKEEMIEKDFPLEKAKQNESEVFAVVAFLGGTPMRPVVLGFLFPEETELLCGKEQKGNEDGSMFLWKHESNVYVRVAKGSTPEIEISHPSGLLIKVGSDTERAEISNWDKTLRPFKWKDPTNNTESPSPYVHLYHPSGTYFTIDKDGNVEVYVVGDVNETVEGDVTRVIKGSLSETVEVNKTLQVNGDVIRTITGTLTETIEDNVTRTLKGNVQETIEGNLDETVEGAKTETVANAWQRLSDTSIKDTAPSIEHN